MNSAESKITTEPQKNRLMADFLVGRYIPFVFHLNSIFIPFICKNTPNNTFQPIARRIRGFTLIELVVTMAVAAILVAVAVPSMRTFIQSGRLNTQVNDLIGDIAFARSAAINAASTPPLGAGVGICISTNGITCTGGNWRDGRAIFVDANSSNIWDAGETILRFREPLASATSILTVGQGMPPFISFNLGTSSLNKPNVTNVPQGAIFVFCDVRGPADGKQVSLNALGQAVVSSTPPPTCNPLP